MKLTSLSVRSFRNHKQTDLQFSEPVILFYGKNGQGKTNLLDSIHFLSLTKSFQTSSDSLCIHYDDSHFSIKGKFTSDRLLDYEVKVAVNETGKEFSVNGDNSYNQLQMIGLIPTVILTLEDRNITMGTPSDRRRFMDSILFQISRSYIDDTKKLKRIIKQRNDILSSWNKNTAANYDLYEAWTDELISVSIPILKKRLQFVSDFKKILLDLYQQEFSLYEKPDIFYVFNGKKIEDDFDIQSELNLSRKRLRNQEFDRGTTLFGPQRDDLLLLLDKRECKLFASQGQHKLFLLALKFSMWKYLNEVLQEKPIFLIDDIFSELDHDRLHLISKFLPSLGQTFITATDRENFQSDIHAEFYKIDSGKIG